MPQPSVAKWGCLERQKPLCGRLAALQLAPHPITPVARISVACDPFQAFAFARKADFAGKVMRHSCE